MSSIHGSEILQFADDLETILNSGTEWGNGKAYGKKPKISKYYDKRQLGLAKRINENILIYVNSETVSAYGVGTAVSDTLSYMHEIEGEIEIHTNISEERSHQLTNAVVDLVKRNVAYNGYVSVLLNRIGVEYNQTRNYFKTTAYVVARLVKAQ